MAVAMANLMEQFGVFYDVRQPIPTELISESIFSICDVGQRVFKQAESNLQNMRYDTNVTTSLPLVFIFYDRNISIFQLLRYCFSI